MIKNYKNKIFAIFILLSIVFSFYFVIGRINAEKVYKNYEICADYDDFSRMAFSENKSQKKYFEELSENAITTITVNESTINSMKKDPTSTVETYVDGMDLVVTGSEEELNLIKNGLDSLKEKREIENISNNRIRIKGNPQDLIYFKSDAIDVYGNRVGDDGKRGSILEYIGLGFDSRKIDDIKDIENIQIALRPTFLSDYQDSRFTMERYFSSIDEFGKNQSFVIFSGKEFFKNTTKDENIEKDFIKELNNRKLSLGMIEASNQRGHLKVDGIDPIAKNNSVGKIRAFTTWDYIQTEYDYSIPGHHEGEELTNVYYRAISERNISAIFLKPFIKNDKMLSDPAIYGKVIGNLDTRLENKGYEKGNIKPIGNWDINNKMKFPIAMGTVAAAVILFGIIFGLSSNMQIGLFLFGALLSFVFFILGKKQDFGSMLFNLGAIVTYPSLALCMVMENFNNARKRKRNISFPKIYLHGLLTLLFAILISMIGALMEISYMSGTNYLAELTIFRGVKISQLLPLLLSIFIFVIYVGFYRKEITKPKLEVKELNKVLDESVKFWQAGLGALVLVILALFILRGGNTSAKVPSVELLFRNMLESKLMARPRTKALFIGFPSVFLLIYLGYKKRGEFLILLLTMFTAIGQADIVNTFSHIRTPLNMSFARIVIEFLLAAVLGLILVLVAEIIMKGYDKYIAKKL